ncbi:unnamed protein product [Adineta ricciae]|uniref:Hepatocyte growth factor-regulated tyrosine kinase substrate n=1 Tax=Adineta ricciae TaxID=249248 RepID=A0A813U238_ADIRI|nr:unnamed protein product [Adineta ricciae]CAF1323718.1 unnamed protein product [Adineta ricciae]
MAQIPLTSVKLFDKLLDKTTSPLLLDVDRKSIVELCDVIKTQQVESKYIIQAIKRKLHHENPHVVLHTLECLESITKSCSDSIHKELAQKDFIDNFKDFANKKSPERIRNKVLQLIQCWSFDLGSQYQLFTDAYTQMKAENHDFPLYKESEVMFKTENTASERCGHRECFCCQQIFTTVVPKHHCRACGNLFCSSKRCTVPKFHKDRQVRVCESCYEKLTTEILTSVLPSSAKPLQKKSRVETSEDLQPSLTIFPSELEEEKKRQKNDASENGIIVNEPENLSLKQFDDDDEIDQFTSLAIEHINNFKLRMLSNQQRNRNISTDTAVQSAFVVLQHLHPELCRFMKLLDDKRTCYENLQDKLTQLKDAREALNALRNDHYEKKQQEAFERNRQRQLQLTQALDFMKRKKQEYLEYQQQLYLQRLAQQELEMHNRLEQQRQLALAREQHSHSFVSYNSMQIHPSDVQTSSFVVNRSYTKHFHTNNHYIHPTGQIPLTNSTTPYIHHCQQSHNAPIGDPNNHDPHLIMFN